MVCFLKIIFCIWGALGARANCVSLPYLLFSMGSVFSRKYNPCHAHRCKGGTFEKISTKNLRALFVQFLTAQTDD